MADHTKIEWTEATWNPITGCSIDTPGCINCYAMKLAGTRLRNIPSRVGLTKQTKNGPIWTGEVRFNERWLLQPLQWKRPRMIFVCAHGDLFHENVPDDWIDRVFAVMALAPQHTFQVLTKRSERMRSYMTHAGGKGRQDVRNQLAWVAVPNVMQQWHPGWSAENADGPHRSRAIAACSEWPLPNVWLGVSAERQKEADKRIPDLLRTPAAIRFVSAEPLIGPIDLTNLAGNIDALRGCRPIIENGLVEDLLMFDGLDWVIVGGESGSDARPMHPEWARALRDQCQKTKVALFFKQWGTWAACEPRLIPVPVEKHLWLANDGRHFTSDQWREVERDDRSATPRQIKLMLNVGKAKAGRELDGKLYSEFPQRSAA